MNYKKLFTLALLVATSTLQAMEPKYPIKLCSGQYDELTHNFIMNFISNSTLEQACANIRTLAHTKQNFYKLLNTPYNTRVLIRELAQRYTNGNIAHAAHELNTRGVLPMLCEKSLAIAPALSEQKLNMQGTYLSWLPADVRRMLLAIHQRGQTKAEILKTTQEYIKNNIISDNFNTIEEVASILDGYEKDRKVALVAAAQLIGAQKCNWWVSLVNPSASEKAAADFIRGKFFVQELKDTEAGLKLLEYAAVQFDNKSVRQETQDFLYKFDPVKYKKYGTIITEPTGPRRGIPMGGSAERTPTNCYYCGECGAWFDTQHTPTDIW